MRANWGVFRDRRPDLYWPLMTLDGTTPHQANRAAPRPR
jgi:N-carbamoylputrescine amidase